MFWQNFKKTYPTPPKVLEHISLLNHDSSTRVDPNCFPTMSYLAVSYGLGLFDKDIIEEHMSRVNIEYERQRVSDVLLMHEEHVKSCIPLHEYRED